MEENSELEDQIADVVLKMDLDADVDAVLKHLFAGGSIASVIGITAKELEAVYTVAYNFYSQAVYDKAHALFAFLVYYDHSNSKYWMGAGGCLQMQKKYDEAVLAYSQAALHDPMNPSCSYYAGRCLLELEEWEASSKAFDAVVLLTKNPDPKTTSRERDSLRNRSAQFLNVIRKHLDAQGEAAGSACSTK